MRFRSLPLSLTHSLVALAVALPVAAATRKAGAPAGAAHHPAKAAASGLKVAPGDTLATISTVKGPIVVELYTRATPLTAGNFVKLARKGFYNGLAFHRVEPGFVIQGGDPNSRHYAQAVASNLLGQGGPGYTIKLEPAALKFKHDRGVVAMARTSDPDSAGSQFYITLGLAHFLDGKYAVFGKVLKGMDVADRIRPGDKINKVTIGR